MKIYNYPKWLQVLYPGSIWGFFRPKKSVLYLTFDDGPSIVATTWILDILDKYEAKASFFCLGESVVAYPELFKEIQNRGHTIGNHSMDHPEGLKTKTKDFLNNVLEAEQYIPSKLFRPPYGSLKFSQHRALKKNGFKTIFWSFITYDYQPGINTKKVILKMKRMVKSGDIIVFHDSLKSNPQMRILLPQLLDYYHNKGFTFEKLPD